MRRFPILTTLVAILLLASLVLIRVTYQPRTDAPAKAVTATTADPWIIWQGTVLKDTNGDGVLDEVWFDYQTGSGKTGLRKVDDATVVGFFNRLYQAVKNDAEATP